MAVSIDSGANAPEQRSVDGNVNAVASKARFCEHCSAAFIEGRSGPRQRALGQRQRFCSVACRGKSQRRYADKQEARQAERERASARKVRQHARCTECEAPARKGAKTCSAECHMVRLERRRSASRPVVHFLCAHCGSGVTADYGDTRTVYCGTPCSRAADRAKSIVNGQRSAQRRAGKLRKKVATVEVVNPMVVFARDRWACQLCGTKTPKRLRGLNVPGSPEVDHIIPLAVGGEHSYRNTQCACRACNLAKSAKALGQMRLFG